MSENPYSNLEIANLFELGAATIKTQMATIKALEAQLREKTEEIDRLRLGLRSIANNTCCVPCREAALVAKATLADSGSKPSL